ncbi:nuclear pore complex protein Nup155-like [Ylistrum balloti]|uniref:nuclear pore complex protein Nup155-like n=1 Tax=Ylistrum balloti TaxID=509963 RepID=UPI002905A7A4|nr:nuclear pore complex protein Nup155-like [Ylistrum balloti]
MASFMASGVMSPPSHQDVMDSAGRLLDKHMQDDRSYLDLSDQLKVPVHNQPCVSGLNELDYPSLPEARVGLECLPEISNVKLVPLPPELMEQFGRMQCNCMMGLFPDVERAWLAIDSDIFVWRYEDGSDLAYFDGLSETILSVALVKPKVGIFQPHIQYLLCLATHVDIVLLGVSFSAPREGISAELGNGEMHLLPEPLFSIPTDNTYIMNIIGSDNGRIFMAGKDGCLYELAYQADDGWFSRKCRKINHSTSTLSFLIPSFLNFSFSEDDPLVQLSLDQSRHILYARSEKGTIQVFDLGQDGNSMGRVTAIPLQTIVHNAWHIARTIERSNFKPLVHISAITRQESANIHLVAVTQSGVRLYFSTNNFGNNKGRPCMLTLVHVRLPPGFSATAGIQKPSNIHTAYHKNGTLLLVSSQSEESDAMWTISGDSFPFQNQLMEAQTTIPVNGRTWAVCEIPSPALEPGIFRQAKPGALKADPPAVVTQHTELPRRFVLLTAQGSHILSKLRPVDQLRQLLIDCQGPDAEEVKGFFRLHRIEQACATCLILACSRLAADQPIANWATMAFFMYGGEAQYNYGGGGMGMDRSLMASNIGPSGLHPTVTSTPAPGMGHGYFHPSLTPGPNMGQDVLFSGKHNGICLYLSRILRCIWETAVATDFPYNTPQGILNYLTCSFTTEELTQILENIRGLSDFVDFNSRYETGPSDSNLPPVPFSSHLMGPVDDQLRKTLQGEAQKMEKISLQHIQDLIHRVEEVLGLLKILVDHQFHIVANQLSKDQQNQLRTMMFKHLVVSGKDICSSLITCLINRYLDDNATIDAINNKLREICPSLYSSDDATCSKASELLQAARVNQNQAEKKRQLGEALKLYKEVSQPLQLTVVCSQFANVHYYDGIVDLCLTLAHKRDPQHLALHFYRSGEPPEDLQGMSAYMSRMECYNCITGTLGFLSTTSTSFPQAPKVPGPPPTPDPSRLSPQEADQFKSDIFRLALKSDDELFHVALYDWLYSMNQTEKLLEIQSPFLEPYLKRKTGYQSEAVGALDMLWKYYEKSRNFPAAAKILSRLAERHGTDVRLQQRIEYLSRAIMCAKSSTSRTSSAAEGEFLHELEEKMEVGRLQLQVQNALSKIRDRNQQNISEALSRLDSDLLDLTLLYEEFADKYDLSECKLAIIHCAGLFDAALVENLWQSIIDKEVDGTMKMTTPMRITNIRNKMEPIGKQYMKTERYFPLAFLVKYIEQRSCELDFTASWVYEMMLEIGVPPPKLLEIYDRMFKSRDPYWQTIQKPLHLLDVLSNLLAHLTANPSLIPVYERRPFSTLCLDFVATYLVELQTMRMTDHHRRLVGLFKRLQAELERL